METKEKTYADLVAEMTAAAECLLQNMAWSQVRDIAAKCSTFKIGKTGEELNARFNQEDYKDKYHHIKAVYSSKSSRLVDKMEVYLIQKAKLFPNCQNIKGTSSLYDTMTPDTNMYYVYIVWND